MAALLVEKELTAQIEIPAAGGVGVMLGRGDLLRVIDIAGGQSGDLVALSADGSERLSNGRSFDYNRKIYLSAGDVLWSDRSNRMLTIVADEAGRHDFLYAPCDMAMYRFEYGTTDYRANCADNLTRALADLGIAPGPLPASFNLFMRADVGADGGLAIAPPVSQAGDAIVFRAEMDLAIAMSACPATSCNGGTAPQPLAFEVIPASVVAEPA
jgi:uncharacterized protein YcgI (DUF1989 family)